MRLPFIVAVASLVSALSAPAAVAQDAPLVDPPPADAPVAFSSDAVPPPPAAATAPAATDSEDEFDPRYDIVATPPPPTGEASRLAPPSPYGAAAPSTTAPSTTAVPPPPGVTLPVFVPALAPPEPATAHEARRRHRRARWAPDLQPGTRLELRLLPFASDVAGGALLAFRFRHQTPSGFWSSLRVGPIGLAHAGSDNVGVGDATALIGMAWRLFGVGFGAGIGYVRIEDTTRRTRGFAPTYSFYLRVGARYGVHLSLTTLGAIVGGDTVSAGVRMRLRIPIRHRDLLDFDIDVVPAMAYFYTGASWERGLGARAQSRLRIRPHIGIVEVIDPVHRDGGAGLSIGVALIYRTDGPAEETSPRPRVSALVAPPVPAPTAPRMVASFTRPRLAVIRGTCDAHPTFDEL